MIRQNSKVRNETSKLWFHFVKNEIRAEPRLRLTVHCHSLAEIRLFPIKIAQMKKIKSYKKRGCESLLMKMKITLVVEFVNQLAYFCEVYFIYIRNSTEI